jgi:hypothetical protein
VELGETSSKIATRVQASRVGLCAIINFTGFGSGDALIMTSFSVTLPKVDDEVVFIPGYLAISMLSSATKIIVRCFYSAVKEISGFIGEAKAETEMQEKVCLCSEWIVAENVENVSVTG